MSTLGRRPGRRLLLNPLSLELLIGVTEEGSIAAVAKRHHLAASAVSKRLSDLETVLGLSLIRRTNRGIEPTQSGAVLTSLARNVLNDIEEIYFRMREYSEGLRGQVRLMANRSSIIGYLPFELKAFAAQHPDIHVRLEERLSTVIVRSVLENEADIGIFWSDAGGHDLESSRYHIDEMVVITPIDHPLGSSASLRFGETLDEDFIGLHDEAVMLLHKAASETGRPLKVRIQVASFDAMCAMVGTGLGIGVLPRACIAPESVDVRLRVVPLNESWVYRKLNVGVRSYKGLTAAARLLYDHLAVGTAAARAKLPERRA